MIGCQIVVKFVSQTVRDSVLSKASLLDKQNGNTVFDCEGVSKVYINRIYTKPVYLIRKSALKVSKYLHYACPVVRNQVVCMRKIRESPLIPIVSDKDLHAHPPNELNA